MAQTVFQTATPQPVVDFVPTKQYPSFSEPINQTLTLSAVVGTSATLTYAQVLGGMIFWDTSSGAVNAIMPAAALLVPQIEGVEVGSTVRLLIRKHRQQARAPSRSLPGPDALCPVQQAHNRDCFLPHGRPNT